LSYASDAFAAESRQTRMIHGDLRGVNGPVPLTLLGPGVGELSGFDPCLGHPAWREGTVGVRPTSRAPSVVSGNCLLPELRPKD